MADVCKFVDDNKLLSPHRDFQNKIDEVFGSDTDSGSSSIDTDRADRNTVKVGETSDNPWMNPSLPQEVVVDDVAPANDLPTILLSLSLYVDDINNCLHNVHGMFAISDGAINDAYHEVIELYGDVSAAIADDIAKLVAQKVVENGHAVYLVRIKYYWMIYILHIAGVCIALTTFSHLFYHTQRNTTV